MIVCVHVYAHKHMCISLSVYYSLLIYLLGPHFSLSNILSNKDKNHHINFSLDIVKFVDFFVCMFASSVFRLKEASHVDGWFPKS